MYVHCGPMGQLGLLPDLEREMTKFVAGEAVGGIPYRIHIEFGLIVPRLPVLFDSDPQTNLISSYSGYPSNRLKDHLKQYGEYRDIEISDLVNEKKRLIMGSALNAWMMRAKTVRAVTEAIFRRQDVTDDVVEGVGRGLNSKHIIFISVVHPHGGIPDDVYEELSRLMFAMGVDPVYHYSGFYMRSQNSEALPQPT